MVWRCGLGRRARIEHNEFAPIYCAIGRAELVDEFTGKLINNFRVFLAEGFVPLPRVVPQGIDDFDIELGVARNQLPKCLATNLLVVAVIADFATVATTVHGNGVFARAEYSARLPEIIAHFLDLT